MIALDTTIRPVYPRCAAPGLGQLAGCRWLVAVIGPPAVGKSTATAQAAKRGARVVRLREFAERYRVNHPELNHLFTTADALGWLPQATVRILLDSAIDGLPPAGTVVLENLPGNAVQLRHLVESAAATGFRLQIVEFAAPDSVLWSRARRRRVCPGCEPDPRGDPHRPAHGRADLPSHCARCGGPLVARRSDEPHLFRARLVRFRDNHPGIRAAAHELHVPYQVIDASADRAALAHAFLTACQSPVPPTCEEHPR